MKYNGMSRMRILFAASCMTGAVLVVGGLLLGVQSASAVDDGPTVINSCLQQIFADPPVKNSNKLNCTANDISLGKVLEVSPTKCTKGTTIPFLQLKFELDVTANSRYDAALVTRIDGSCDIATDPDCGYARGDGVNATGTCAVSWFNNTGGAASNLDMDTCGDFNSGIYITTLTIPNVECADLNGDKMLDLPYCTSWHSNQGTVCTAPTNISSDGTSYTGDTGTFHPDTKSKCVCDDDFSVPVEVEDAEIVTTKTASPTTRPESGGVVSYTASVHNSGVVNTLYIYELLDDPYGNLLAIPDCSGDPTAGMPGPCADSSVTTPCNTLTNYPIAPGGDVSCVFKAWVSGDAGDEITDTVEYCADSSSDSGNTGETSDCDDDDATVTITDEQVDPSLTKSAVSSVCQRDVTYTVVVTNNSTIDTLTLQALADNKFDGITAPHAAGGGYEQVVSTTCGVAIASGGAGALPYDIAASGNYTCQFVGRINGCDYTHMNTVTGTTLDDDLVSRMPTGSATVYSSTSPPSP